VRDARKEKVLTPMDSNSVWRSTLILSFASCYIMWGMPASYFLRFCGVPDALGQVGGYRLTGQIAITFMAQWHPLIKPLNSSLRPEYVP